MKTPQSRFPMARAAFGATLLLLAGAPGRADTPISRQAPADPAGSVEISNTSGRVDVSAWDRNVVAVTGTLGEGSERLDFTTAGKVTRIKVVLPNKSWGVEDTELVVRVPAGSSLSINTVSADIRVHGVRGAQRLQSVSADVSTEAGAEDVECKTVSGDVAVAGSGQKGMLTVTTVSGDAVITRVGGELNANTVSGNFTITAGDVARSRLRSTSGDLSLASRLAPDGRLDIESISGDVRLDFAAPVSAEFDVSSFSGDIRSCFGPKAARTSEYGPGKELRFVEGRSDARVRVKTMNGDVTLCRK